MPARRYAKLSACLVGQVANDGSGPTYQGFGHVVLVDSDTYNGSPRWFQVYVPVNGGYTNWLFVHSSFVSNQPAVGKCNSGGY
ncbi:hypothetical protein [Rhodococcus sp. 14-2470-1a]|uniref:hypothetical protein n=1 Tax=Rhodococcus sp. 14-2470-1a TaxID=2023150 RepID=UPI001179C9D7|nr:hypothetical protein [Rhodococcus sp. 14-2470-1a]